MNHYEEHRRVNKTKCAEYNVTPNILTAEELKKK